MTAIQSEVSLEALVGKIHSLFVSFLLKNIRKSRRNLQVTKFHNVKDNETIVFENTDLIEHFFALA